MNEPLCSRILPLAFVLFFVAEDGGGGFSLDGGLRNLVISNGGVGVTIALALVTYKYHL